jgi:prolyl 4-hydroxylase
MTTSVQPRPELEAQFLSGMDVLAEAIDRRTFENGVALVEQSAAGGHADALSQVATFEALGAARVPNWSRAFDLLQQAAERGSQFAQAQLRLLSESEQEDDWAALRSRIDLGQLLNSPQPSILSDRPRIVTIEGFAKGAECDWIMERFRPKLRPAMIWDKETNVGQIDPARSNSAVELKITEMDVVIAVVRARISSVTGLPEPQFEVPQVMHYLPGQEFLPHYDFLNPQLPGQAADIAQRGQRIATFLIFLNEDFEGGETEFPQLDLRHKGRKGDALLFSNIGGRGKPDMRTLHAGRPPTSGEKWIVSQWIRDRMPAV